MSTKLKKPRVVGCPVDWVGSDCGSLALTQSNLIRYLIYLANFSNFLAKL